MLNLFINTWGNYNVNGADGGEWVTLPMDAEELEEKMQAIAANMGDHDPEFFINDYEYTSEIELGEIGEHDNILELNELCSKVSDLSEWEAEEVAAAVEAFGYNFPEAVERQQEGRFIFYRGWDLEEVAEEIVQDCYFGKDTPDIFTRYFDYAAFARDLGFDGYTETKWGVICDC